jgi:hypothetical protein
MLGILQLLSVRLAASSRYRRLLLRTRTDGFFSTTRTAASSPHRRLLYAVAISSRHRRLLYAPASMASSQHPRRQLLLGTDDSSCPFCRHMTHDHGVYCLLLSSKKQ